MTQTQKNLEELKARGGIVKSSQWTTGHGKHTSQRAIPAGAKKYDRRFPQGYTRGIIMRDHTAPWSDRPDVAAFFAANPRITSCIAVDLPAAQESTLVVEGYCPDCCFVIRDKDEVVTDETRLNGGRFFHCANCGWEGMQDELEEAQA